MSHRPFLPARDARVCWHPYTQHATEPRPLPVASAHGATLVLEDGRKVLDAISSWWTCLHGHGHRRLVEAAREQMERLDHVMFAGCTHEPAVALAEHLIETLPDPLSRVFFSDNGSTAVEVALKMVFQRWAHAGEPERKVFVALDGGYHGDTFGAMAVGDPDPFFQPFQSLLFSVRRVPVDAQAVDAALATLGERAAGVVIEPLVQAAGGMRMHGPELLRAVRESCNRHGVPMIADEVMTGFGRTGSLFACQQAEITPDVMCLAKGLTGGSFPLAVTVTNEAMYESFLSVDRARALFHGHTFTANPVGCAIAVASIELCLENRLPERFEAIGQRIESRLLEAVVPSKRVKNLRRCGGIVALDLVPPAGAKHGYLSELAPKLRAAAIERCVLLRPLGNVLYAMPPACVTQGDCDRIAQTMAELALMDV